eukprot:COSAG01_NODE_57216_length_313_cov_1.490654_1_plen_39_part_01
MHRSIVGLLVYDSGITQVYAYPSGDPARLGIQTQIEKKK